MLLYWTDVYQFTWWHLVLQNLHSSPSKALLFLTYLSDLPSSAIATYRHAITSTFHLLLDPPSVSRRVQALYVTIWTKINSVTPRKYVKSCINIVEKTWYHINLSCMNFINAIMQVIVIADHAHKWYLRGPLITRMCANWCDDRVLTLNVAHQTTEA